MDSVNDRSIRKVLLVMSLVINLGLLAYFKYMNFFVNNFNILLEQMGIQPGPTLHILLPIGISFFVFESLTYVIDVYRKEQKALDNFSHYLLYIFFFPKMIAGPIVRYAEISNQIEDRHTSNHVDNFLNGFGRFTTGLAKKVLIADVLGVYTDAYARNIDAGFNVESSWLAAIAFTMQVYFDFSGYSDMAIGLARMFGFKLNENFNNPFNSTSITEFWKRWHMSFTRWIKQYVYIPLGGNQKSSGRTILNLWVIFLISGLWHGAAWNYVIWGALHGFIITTEKILHFNKWENRYKWVSIPLTSLAIVVTTLLLKSSNLHISSKWYQSMFGISHGNLSLPMMWETIIALIIAIVFSFITLNPIGKRIENNWYNFKNAKNYSFKPILWIVLWLFSLSYITGHKFTSFIYYMF